MKPWIACALLSMGFAGVTAVIAKLGLSGIPADLGMTVRTLVVFLLVMAFAGVTLPVESWRLLNGSNWAWLGLSGLTTALSWIFYYRALKDGEVSTLALIDKGSVLVAMLLAVLILGEKLTLRSMGGACLVLAGLFLIARK